MNTATNRFQPGTTYDQHMKVEKQLRQGWVMMWIATVLFLIFPVSILLACIALGHGIGSASWPGFRSKGLKLAFWSIMGPMTPWILFVGAGLFWRATH